MATAYFLYLLTRMSRAEKDQEHMEILMHSKPSIPDRTSYILGSSDENPAEEMIALGRELRSIGAELLAIPCITAHYFHEELEKVLGSRYSMRFGRRRCTSGQRVWRRWASSLRTAP